MVSTPAARRKPNVTNKPFQPAIGGDFPVSEVPTIEAKTRGFLTRSLIIVTGLAIVTTGSYGLWTGEYTAIIAVWAVAGPIVGAIVSHYFGVPRKDTG
jgi:hypothetical protein